MYTVICCMFDYVKLICCLTGIAESTYSSAFFIICIIYQSNDFICCRITTRKLM